MIRTLLVVTASALSVAGCVSTTPVTLQNSFNASEVAWAAGQGSNTVEGSALLRQQGGGVVTCAGETVRLIPYSTYAAERMAYTYSSPAGGYANAVTNAFRAPLPSNAAYEAEMRLATCDAQGRFAFRNLPDGDYYAVTTVSWTVGYNTQGGSLAQRVSVAGGETKDIVLTAK